MSDPSAEKPSAALGAILIVLLLAAIVLGRPCRVARL